MRLWENRISTSKAYCLENNLDTHLDPRTWRYKEQFTWKYVSFANRPHPRWCWRAYYIFIGRGWNARSRRQAILSWYITLTYLSFPLLLVIDYDFLTHFKKVLDSSVFIFCKYEYVTRYLRRFLADFHDSFTGVIKNELGNLEVVKFKFIREELLLVS